VAAPAVLSNLGRVALDLLFPPRCVLCGRHGAALCDVCAGALPCAEPPRCPRCWSPRRLGSGCRRCDESASAGPGVAGLRSPYVFKGGARELVHALKYHYHSALASTMGELMARYLRDNSLPADVLAPVPLHPRRQRARGYNQSFLLAREVSRRLDLPLAAATLVRRSDTPPQARTAGGEARRRNVAGAFDCRPGAVAGRRVLLVDDVTTTGATLDACARALLAKGGASSVWALTFARED
jgi:ComF family protein